MEHEQLQSEVTTGLGPWTLHGASILPPLRTSGRCNGLLDAKTVLKYSDMPGEGRERLVIEERTYQAYAHIVESSRASVDMKGD